MAVWPGMKHIYHDIDTHMYGMIATVMESTGRRWSVLACRYFVGSMSWRVYVFLDERVCKC